LQHIYTKQHNLWYIFKAYIQEKTCINGKENNMLITNMNV